MTPNERERIMRLMLDGRENDERITVEVSLLWSLLDAPPDEERLARALQLVVDNGEAPALWREDAAAIAKAYAALGEEAGR